jgi:hypothetical protein
MQQHQKAALLTSLFRLRKKEERFGLQKVTDAEYNSVK